MKRIAAYLKLVFLVTVVLVVALVAFNNRKNVVNVWFFKSYEQINVLWLMLVTSVISIVTWWLLTATFGVWRDLRELAAEAERKQKDKQHEDLARKLAETEKRIDGQREEAKVRQSEDTG